MGSMPNQIWTTAMVNATPRPKISVAMSVLPPAVGVCQESACFAENETSAIAILPKRKRTRGRAMMPNGSTHNRLVEIGFHVLHRKIARRRLVHL